MVDRQFAHYLYEGKAKLWFKSEEIVENNAFMHFDCPEHPTLFVRGL